MDEQLKIIADNLVDRETNASVDSHYRKILEKYVLIGLKYQQDKLELKINALFDPSLFIKK